MKPSTMDLLSKDAINSIEICQMDAFLKSFVGLDRLSGSDGAEQAADYIMAKLTEAHIDCRKYVFDAYLSNPRSSKLELLENGGSRFLESRPRTFSADCREGIEGELIYDINGSINCYDRCRMSFYENVRDKIVLSYNGNEDYVKVMEKYGAAGIVQIWSSDEEIIHEETVGPVWGTPTLEKEYFLPGIPVIGTNKRTGEELIEAMKNKRLKVKVYADIETVVRSVSLPTAEIKGKTDDFILLSGHYDSWFYGITDNGTGNAACFELARVFAKYADQMEKGLRVAWWPGHSNGRYAGSAWYCDNFWEDIYGKCYAHINIDSPGCMGAERAYAATSEFEGRDFMGDIIQEYTGVHPDEFYDLSRGADQSFWGADIPIHIMPIYKQKLGNKVYASYGSGGGWWWHTQEDTYDKADLDILLRDTKMIAAAVGKLVFSQIIPCNPEKYFIKIKNTLLDIDKNSDVEFDFHEIYRYIDLLWKKTETVLGDGSLSARNMNAVIKIVGGGMNRLMYSYSGRYEFDYAIPLGIFPYINRVKGIYRHNSDKKIYLFLKTDFIRQRNRLITEIKIMLSQVDLVVKQI